MWKINETLNAQNHFGDQNACVTSERVFVKKGSAMGNITIFGQNSLNLKFEPRVN